MSKAVELREDFTGHRTQTIDELSIQWPKSGLTIGKCLAIMYETTRDGKTEAYKHDFKPSSRPFLVSSSDGKLLLLVGDKFKFTNAGIVDQ